MKRTHMNKIGTLLAAAVFVVALWPVTVRAQAQAAPQDKPAAQAPSRPRDMVRDLNITPEQQKKIWEFRDARLKEGQAFREQMSKMRTEMRDLMKDPKANVSKIDGLIDNMSKLHADREKAAFRTRGEFEKLFTPEQLEKMKTFRGALMGRPGFGGPGGAGFFRPGMDRSMGPMGGWGMRMGFGARAAWGWRMRGAAWRWRHHFFGHPFFWRGW